MVRITRSKVILCVDSESFACKTTSQMCEWQKQNPLQQSGHGCKGHELIGENPTLAQREWGFSKWLGLEMGQTLQIAIKRMGKPNSTLLALEWPWQRDWTSWADKWDLPFFLAIRQLCFFVWAAPRIPATATQKRTMSYNSQGNLHPESMNRTFFHRLCWDPGASLTTANRMCKTCMILSSEAAHFTQETTLLSAVACVACRVYIRQPRLPAVSAIASNPNVFSMPRIFTLSMLAIQKVWEITYSLVVKHGKVMSRVLACPHSNVHW